MSGYSELEAEDGDETEQREGVGEKKNGPGGRKGKRVEMKTSNAFIIGCQMPA